VTESQINQKNFNIKLLGLDKYTFTEYNINIIKNKCLENLESSIKTKVMLHLFLAWLFLCKENQK
jgi:hypothetical protein